VNETPAGARRSDIRLLYAARCLRGVRRRLRRRHPSGLSDRDRFEPRCRSASIATVSLFGTAVLTLLVGLIAAAARPAQSCLLGAGLHGVYRDRAGRALNYLTFIAVGGLRRHDQSFHRAISAWWCRWTCDCWRGTRRNQERTRTFARYSLIGARSRRCAGRRMDRRAPPADYFVAWGFTKPAAFKLMSTSTPRSAPGRRCCIGACPTPWPTEPAHAPLGPSRGIVYKLAALSARCLCGGFIAQVAGALWLFQKFEMSSRGEPVLFWSGVASAFS